MGCDGSYESNDDEMVTELNRNALKFMAVGDSGTVLTSSDGKSWTIRDSGTSQSLYSITIRDNDVSYLAVGNLGKVLTSSDGIAWISKSSGTTQNLREVTYSNSNFVAVGGYGTIITSTDGNNWHSKSPIV